jgi:predicted amidohydrolase YtcJ
MRLARLEDNKAQAASVRTEVAVGAPADLVIADADPAAADGPAALAATPVAGTLVAGRWTHRDGL